MKFLGTGDEEPIDATFDDTDALRDEIRELRRELAQSRSETAAAKREAGRALSALRKQLHPLYQALQAVFGELDAIGDDTPAAASNTRSSAVWENWKSKLGIGAAKCIDAMLLHGEMNTQQLSIATGYHRNTVPQYISHLNKAGLIVKNGGRFALKKLPGE